jgi:glucose-1-phosphate cytidylyltransferase
MSEEMKVVILCGGLGTRLSEETQLKPKPIVEIGGMPILWHIMKIYDQFGYRDFSLALGYKGEIIKDFFINYKARNSDLELNLQTGNIDFLSSASEDWNVSLIDTGQLTLTGGRLLRLKKYINSTFMLTYGDGVADVDIGELIKFHKSHKKIATVTSVRPTARFGGMTIENSVVEDFQEKPQAGEGWINGGFFVFEPEVFDYLTNDKTILERDPLENLSKDGELMAFKHEGFWQCMDTIREKNILEEICASNDIPWLNI